MLISLWLWLTGWPSEWINEQIIRSHWMQLWSDLSQSGLWACVLSSNTWSSENLIWLSRLSVPNLWPQHHLRCRTTVIHITGCCPTRWKIPTSHCLSKVRIPSEHWAVWITAMTVGGKLSRASSSLADSSSHITSSSVFFCLALLDGIGVLNSSRVDKGENTAFRRQQYITSSFQRTTLQVRLRHFWSRRVMEALLEGSNQWPQGFDHGWSINRPIFPMSTKSFHLMQP